MQTGADESYRKTVDNSTRNIGGTYERSAGARPQDRQRPDLSDVAAGLEANLSPDLAAELVAHLRLPPWVATELLPAFGVGWWPSGKSINGRRVKVGGWTVREKDATGRTVGIHIRRRSGAKRAYQGGGRGLSYAPGWRKRAIARGLLFLVEGFSDLLTLSAAGHAVISRPSNVGGVEYLAGLLWTLPKSVKIVCVGERDYKLNRDHWPGRHGAYTTATKLADRIGRPVLWGLVPGKKFKNGQQAKDSRQWFLLSSNGGRGTVNRWAALGDRFAALMLTDAIPAQPAGPSEPMPLREPDCPRPPRVRLVGKEGTTAEGVRAAIEPRCRCWKCGPCKVWQQNRWRARIWRCLLRSADWLHYPPHDSDPKPSGPPMKNGRSPGPWELYAVVAGEKQRAAILASMGGRRKQHRFRVFSYLSVELANPDHCPGVSAKSWSLVCMKGDAKKISDQEKTYLIVFAVHPTVKPHRDLRRITPAQAWELADAAILNAPTVPVEEIEDGTRQHPVTASDDWRPVEEDYRSDRWKREGRFAPSARYVDDLAVYCGMKRERPVVAVQDSAAWSGEELRSWTFGQMTEPSVCDRRPDMAAFLFRLDRWCELLAGVTIGPEVVKELHTRLNKVPGLDDREAVAAAVERDADAARYDAECRKVEAWRMSPDYAAAVAASPLLQWLEGLDPESKAAAVAKQDRLRQRGRFSCLHCHGREFLAAPPERPANVVRRKCARCGRLATELQPVPFTRYSPPPMREATPYELHCGGGCPDRFVEKIEHPVDAVPLPPEYEPLLRALHRPVAHEPVTAT